MKKQKLIAILSLIHVAFLLVTLTLILIAAILHAEGIEIFFLTFLVVALLGYLVIIILQMKTYKYICPNCKKEVYLNLFTAIFSKTYMNQRKLKCKHCNKVSYMDRELR